MLIPSAGRARESEPALFSKLLLSSFTLGRGPRGRSESAGRGPGDAQVVTTHRPIPNPWSGQENETLSREAAGAAATDVPDGVGRGGGERAPPRVSEAGAAAESAMRFESHFKSSFAL